MGKIDAVLFDLDGTVLKLGVTMEDVEAARGALRRLFLEHGVDAVFRPILKTTRESLEVLRERGLGGEEIAQKAYRIIDEMEEGGANRSAPCVGMKEVLGQLMKEGYVLGIVSNNGKRGIETALKMVGLSPALFSTIVSRDDLEEEKPSPASILLALDRLGSKGRPWRVVFVGDRIDDMKCGKSGERILPAGSAVITVRVGNEMCGQEEMTETGLVDYFIPCLEQLPFLLKKIESETNS